MLNFLSSKKSSSAGPLIGYKITNIERSKKYGVAADSLRMLKTKASEKFKLQHCRVYLAQDGVEVLDEDYFSTLPAQILFVVAEKDIIVKTDFELMYDAIKTTHSDLLQAGTMAKEFVSNNQSEIARLLQDAQRLQDEQTARSLRSEHGEWFEGMDEKLGRTKEEIMQRRGQDRIRGYFYKTKDELTKCAIYRKNLLAKELIDEMLELFRQLLIGFDYFSFIFDRSHPQRLPDAMIPNLVLTDEESKHEQDEVDAQRIMPKRMKLAIKKSLEDDDNAIGKYRMALCNSIGEFRCMGLWNEKQCRYGAHVINPYASRENMILFQVWNLDHQVEISRTVLPSIVENVTRVIANEADAICKIHNRKGKNLSVITYFIELFTLGNLKLVHIVCHDKSMHDLISRGAIICDKCAEFKYITQFQSKMRFNKDALM
ncbi:DNA fragmentation factor subunit beta-like [Topomyia yanbarensis]|uniref:DNA fragmentation factor subunit beta-like n=1 Tax=Topomyia yanbarensis TaxID=2498891 RepID=UPI00273C2279|nr:DNA fragmentation factor subunit beta-like [Topomyia yanbarensis]